MRHVSIAEGKDKFSEIVAAAEVGEEIVITRHGREVAKVVGMEQDRLARQRKAIEGLLALREELRAKGVTATRAEWTEWKNEGRR